MPFEYVPLLHIQRELLARPRTPDRFAQYLRLVWDKPQEVLLYPPLVAMNPMSKEHVAEHVETLLAMNVDALAQATLAEFADVEVSHKVGLVVVDDVQGGWTNRVADEFTQRFGGRDATQPRPRWLADDWLTCVLWASEAPSVELVQQTIRQVVHRHHFVQTHGVAATLQQMLDQEGTVLAAAGCGTPTLDADDLAYTGEVLQAFLHVSDARTCMECLFGDEPCRALGFTPRGLSPWAGLAWALHVALTKASSA